MLEDDFGAHDRKQMEGGDDLDGADERETALLLGQPFDQRIARPKSHWSALASEGAWTAVEHGNAVHGLLGELRDASDWPRLKNHMVEAALWTAEQRATLIDLVEAVLADPAMSKFFESRADEVFAERTVHVGNGKLERPDRVVLLDGEWHVIDFKTGQERDKDRSQVARYCGILQSMHPEAVVKGWLIYTESLQLVDVPVLFGGE